MDEIEKNDHDSALRVNEGIPQPPAISEESVERFKNIRRFRLTVDEYVEGILRGDRTILSRAITLVESNLPAHHALAQQIIQRCIPYSGKSFRIGITGIPGVGKSSFIEAFGMHVVNKGHKLAVLAIDPSSERTKGSILGDKTRMEHLSSHPNAFIRPSPSAGSLGGVARKTRETIYLCEAAGFDVVFVETVGVGQSETTVHSMVDFFLLLALAGAGDELQGIKRGIMEMADAIVITKADGDNIERAMRAKAELQNALHFFPPTPSGWQPLVKTCSAHLQLGIDEIWQMLEHFKQLVINNGYFDHNRNQQAKFWIHQTVQEMLTQSFYQQHEIVKLLNKLENEVLQGSMTSFEAAQRLFELYSELIVKK
ncbi:MAG: methylmalonyl Co-A mutase-associated GTPase MeaB [Bacteroidales bacterium]|nr:methylmalonyl Co-A mutase-associated GTPase MeaB [Bacteroidales bacterium]